MTLRPLRNQLDVEWSEDHVDILSDSVHIAESSFLEDRDVNLYFHLVSFFLLLFQQD